jgi:hypothetical protein
MEMWGVSKPLPLRSYPRDCKENRGTDASCPGFAFAVSILHPLTAYDPAPKIHPGDSGRLSRSHRSISKTGGGTNWTEEASRHSEATMGEY